MRRAADYLASLRDGRAIFLDGERVDDVTKHPAFAESVRRIAERYDAAAESPDITTCLDPDSGRRIGAMWLIPRSAEDLGRRRAVHRFWAEGSYGLMGRTPDHVASVLTGFAGWRQLFDRGRDYSRALRVQNRLLCLRPSSPEHLKDRGILHYRLALFGQALADFEACLRLAPGAADAAALREQMGRLRLLTPVMN